MITFNGITILGDTEGGITDFQQGTMVRRREYYENARGDGEGVKFFSKPGTSHTVQFTFDNVPLASVDSIKTRVLQFADSQVLDTLEITDYGFSADNCVCDSVQLEREITRTANVVSETMTYTKVKELQFTMTFRQLK